MVTDEKIDRIYESVIASGELTTKELQSFEITANDIRALCKQEIIERVKRGQYQIKNLDGLFYYGKKLIAQRQYSKADLCFQKCFELNPNHLGACFQLFIRCVRSKNYDDALMYLDKLFTSDNRYYLRDANYYLYLLSMLTELSEKEQLCVKDLKIQDILVRADDKRFEDVQMENQIRIAAYQKKFAEALKMLKDFANKQSKKTVQAIIEKELLWQNLEKNQKMYKDLFALIKDKKYLEAIDLLEQKKSQLELSIIENSILELLHDYIQIEKTGVVPLNEIKICNNVFEAISTKDYFHAYELNSAYNVQKGIDDKLSILSILLEDICKLIRQISEKNMPITIETSIKEDETNKVIDFKASDTQDQEKIMAFIITLLLENDIDNALTLLKKYLQLIGKSEYERKMKEIDDGLMPITYVIIDLFRLKTVNDNLGHGAGDLYIKISTEIIEKYFPISPYEFYSSEQVSNQEINNYIYRIGGDEFVIITDLPVDVVQERLEQVAMEVENLSVSILTNIPTGLNFGISARNNFETSEELSKIADDKLSKDKLAMYRRRKINRRK